MKRARTTRYRDRDRDRDRDRYRGIYKIASNLLLSVVFIAITFVLSSKFLFLNTEKGVETSSIALATSIITKKMENLTGDSISIGFSSSMPKLTLEGHAKYFQEMSSSNQLMIFEFRRSDVENGFSFVNEVEELRENTRIDFKYIKKSVDDGSRLILAIYDSSKLKVSSSKEGSSHAGYGVEYSVCGKNKCADLLYLFGNSGWRQKKNLAKALLDDGLGSTILLGEFSSPPISIALYDAYREGFAPLFKDVSSDYRLSDFGVDEREGDTLKRYTAWKEKEEHNQRRNRASTTMNFTATAKKDIWSSSMTKNILVPLCKKNVVSVCIEDIINSKIFGKNYVFSRKNHLPIAMKVRL